MPCTIIPYKNIVQYNMVVFLSIANILGSGKIKT